MAGLLDGVNWLGVALGVVASFAAGWFYYSPRGLYTAWSTSAGVSHNPGDAMGASFGSLAVGLILYGTFVGIMDARGMTAVAVLAIVTFVVMGYSNNAFKKLGAVSRNIDAGSWALSGVLMIVAQWLV